MTQQRYTITHPCSQQEDLGDNDIAPLEGGAYDRSQSCHPGSGVTV